MAEGCIGAEAEAAAEERGAEEGSSEFHGGERKVAASGGCAAGSSDCSAEI